MADDVVGAAAHDSPEVRALHVSARLVAVVLTVAVVAAFVAGEPIHVVNPDALAGKGS